MFIAYLVAVYHLIDWNGLNFYHSCLQARLLPNKRNCRDYVNLTTGISGCMESSDASLDTGVVVIIDVVLDRTFPSTWPYATRAKIFLARLKPDLPPVAIRVLA